MTPSRLARLVAIGVGAVVLAGCSGLSAADHGAGHGTDHGAHHQGHGSSSPVGADAEAITVTADAFRFDPDVIEIVAGVEYAVELTSIDELHDLVIDGVDVHVAAAAGETAVGGMRIDQPGSYTAYCSVPGHRDAGMTAEVTVTAAGPS